jgi:peroxiredoxin
MRARLAWRVLFPLALVFAVSAALAGWWVAQSVSGARSGGEERRPDFVLPDIEGRQRAISEWDGQVVVLNFWGSWCPPCLKEIPIFNALQREHGPAGLQFVGVAIDRPEDARRFAAESDLAYPSMVGVADAMAVGERYGNAEGVVPYTVLIDRDGVIRHRLRGEVSRGQLEPLILALL